MLHRQIHRLLAVTGLTDDQIALFGQHLHQIHPNERLIFSNDDSLRPGVALRAGAPCCLTHR
ncbi:hypothetical protein GCM10027088_51640 [Nocardia goodfellowii]